MLLGTRLYRALLRESAALPDVQAAAHYRQRVRQHFRKEEVPESSATAVKQVAQANKLLRHLQAANDGYLHSLKRVLSSTYARSGPTKHQLLRPLSHPTPRMKPDYTFPAPLAALVTSPMAHTARPHSRAQLSKPPTLPERADPTTEEARLIGPLDSQRIKAIRGRYFNSQLSKVRAPIAIELKRKDGRPIEDQQEFAKRAGLSKVHLESGRRMLAALETKSQVSAKPLPPRRLQTLEQIRSSTLVPPQVRQEIDDDQRRIFSPSSKNSKWHRPKTVTSRLLRRRYQDILSKSPILVVEDRIDKGSPSPSPAAGSGFSYSVTLSPFARGGSNLIPEASAEDLWWEQQEVELGMKSAPRSSGKSKSKRSG